MRALLIVAGLMLASTQIGCLLAAAAVGTGTTVAYVTGDDETAMAATPQQAIAAAERAAADMELAVVAATSTAIDGRLVARTASDTRVYVSAKSSGGGSSQVSVRVGRFGDDALQRALLSGMEKHLSAERAAQNTAEAPLTGPTTAPTADATSEKTPTSASSASNGD